MTTDRSLYYAPGEDLLNLPGKSPLTYIEWLKYESSFDRDVAFEQYTTYVTVWYEKNNIVNSEAQQQYVRNLYINLLKQISIEYTSPNERRFLSNIDFNDDKDLDIAIPFFAKKIKQIAIYYANQRTEIKFSKIKSNLKGSTAGLSSLIYKKIADIISNDTLVIEQLVDLDLTLNDVLLNLQITIDELYDTEQTYYNISPDSQPEDAVPDTLSRRYNYFNLSVIPDRAKMFISETYTEVIIDLIKQVPLILQTTSGSEADYTLETLVSSAGENFSISETVVGNELDRLSDDFFVKYINGSDLNITYEQLAFQKYVGSDYYYLSTGDTLSETVSGKLFSATSPHKDILNKHYPTVLFASGESVYKREYIGGFFNSTGIGLTNFTTLDYTYHFEPKVNTTYYFPDPAVGARGTYGSKTEIKSPVVYYENVNWNKKNTSHTFSTANQVQFENILRFTSYHSTEQSKTSPPGVSRYNDRFSFWSKTATPVWENDDIYEKQNNVQPIDTRSDQLLNGNKIVYKWKTDIYGNSYALIKDRTEPDKDSPTSSPSTLYDSTYIISDTTKTSNTHAKYNWQTSLSGDTHTNKNLTEKKFLPGQLYIRNNTSQGIHSITDDIFSALYSKYSNGGVITYKDITINLTDISDSILSSLIDFDIVKDVIILETDEYIVLESIKYDYQTSVIASNQKTYTFIYKNYYNNNYTHTSNWWYDESKNRLLIAQSTVHSTLSASNDKMIYPILYNYSIKKKTLVQSYPDPDYTESQLTYETAQYSLSSTDHNLDIVCTKPPVLTYNPDSERYSVNQLLLDRSKNVYYTKTDFRMYLNTIELIQHNFYKHMYFTYCMNPNNSTVKDYYIELNSTKAGDQWYHDNNNNLIVLGATDPGGASPTPTPSALSSPVWTYGDPNNLLEGDRDIVVCFDFAISGDSGCNPHGLSIVFFRGRTPDLSGYESASTGGLGQAFGYLPDTTTGSGTIPTLTGLSSGHACVSLDINGTFGNTSLVSGPSPSPNSIVVSGPLETALEQRAVIPIPGFTLYQPGTTVKNISYTRCRVTLTDLGRRLFVDMMNLDDTTDCSTFTRVVDTQVSDFFPTSPGITSTTTTTPTTTTTNSSSSTTTSQPYYSTPNSMKAAVIFSNGTIPGFAALKNLSITGSDPRMRGGIAVTT